MALLSVQIVTHNSAPTLKACLQSLASQRFRDLSVIAIDNHSSDPSVRILKRFGIRPHINAENLGYARAHNQAIAMTKSTYILTLNPDVVLDTNFLSSMISVLERAGRQIGSAAGKLYRVESLNLKQRKPWRIDSAGIFMRRNRHQGLRFEGQGDSPATSASAPIFGPDGAAAIYKREMLEDIKVGSEYSDEDFFMHKEDVDLCWRAQLRGWQSLYIPQAVGYHVRTFRPRQRHRVDQALRSYGIRNRYFLMMKNELPGHFLADLPRILFYDLGILAYVLFREPKSVGAYGSVLKYLPKMIAKRRLIQARRKISLEQMKQWFT